MDLLKELSAKPIPYPGQKYADQILPAGQVHI